MTLSLEEYESYNPHIKVESNGICATFSTPNRHTVWRAQTLFTKEPDTIEWISTFRPDEILFDIGANVGMYTIWAAKASGVRVFAFEPESQNYALLNKNIYLNDLDKTVDAFCIAVSNETRFDQLHLSEFVPGGSCHNFGEAINFQHERFLAPFTQACFSTTIDKLILDDKAIPSPNHIKIDVDGIEHKVIEGARGTLERADVRSVLIEINTNLEKHWEIIDFMLDLGFDYSQDQVMKSQRKQGSFKGVGNYVFRR
ncbi:FkbM family methyltransferase [Methylocaldum sp.]|uniref:FkbM family methyltransferase n=1 Tax=Methylocaldum sp. TaxID=1969727 RepID=UPI002D744B50|nr:FkbM family methyltransferase [Methylocaldum sp.]HYE36629.1 FkbM family methyltransferase [Methylocaldum sp.]